MPVARLFRDSSGGFEPNIGVIALSGGRASGFGPILLKFVGFTSTPVGSPGSVPVGDSAPATIGNNLAGINTSGTTQETVLWGGVNGSLSGSIAVGQLAFFLANGPINGNIVANRAYLGSVAYVDGTSVSGSVTLNNGTIGRVKATSGDVAGGVTATSGSATLVQASGSVTGNISASSSIGSIVGPSGIGPSTGLSTISAPIINIINSDSGPIRANITASGTATSASGAIQRLRGTSFAGSLTASRVEKLSSGQAWTNAVDFSSSSSATVSVSGDVRTPISFAGGITSDATISLGAVHSAVSITGNLNASMTAASTVSGGAISIGGGIPSGKTLTITNNHAGSLSLGGSLSGSVKIGSSLSGSVTLPTTALAGQIIINAANTGGTWSGDVVVGSATLDSATYDEAASSLGGGSVGVVGYHIHLESCDPPYNRTPGDMPQFEVCPDITLRWYGPVETSGGIPFTVGYTDGFSIQDATSSFTLAADVSDPRQLILSPVTPELPVGVYFFSPYSIDAEMVSSPMFCRNADLGGTPNIPVASDAYAFEIIAGLPRGGGGGSMSSLSSPCIADADCDTSITALDIATFLNLYLTSDTTSATPECPGHTADINGDSVIDASDITTFLAAWYARCE